jgi:SNF2 family DNA or RNA helicase
MSQFLESTPRAKKWTPHTYQFKAVKFCIERGAAGLFLDPGMGKTSIILSTFKVLQDKGVVNSMLIVAPLRVCYYVWRQEAEKWSDFNNIDFGLLHGKHKDKILRTPHDVYLINPEGLKWLLTKENTRFLSHCEMLVIDESTKFKRTSTARFKLIKKWLASFQRRYILTGSPIPNGIMDIFGQIYILDCGVALGRYVSHFRNKYFDQSYSGYDWTPRTGSYEAILDKVHHLLLRMDAKDWLDMPTLHINVIKVEMPEVAKRYYRELEVAFISVIKGEEVTAVNAAAASTKLRQLTNGAVYTPDGDVVMAHDAKLEALKDLIEELSGKPLLVFYQWKHDITRIREALGYEVPYIGGGVSADRSGSLCQSFNMGDLPVLLAHPASAGHGLNLQEISNHVAFFGPTWDLELNDQGLKRVWRQGNPNEHVVIHYLVCKDTIDEVVLGVLRGKDRTQSNLLSALKSVYAKEKEHGSTKGIRQT